MDAFPGMQHQQIAVAGDDQLCADGESTGDDLIIVDVVGHDAGCGQRRNRNEQGLIQTDGVFDGGLLVGKSRRAR